jgi:lipopolysaccharide/colanic/teichoic acid biosynthesis glycosyltransferase
MSALLVVATGLCIGLSPNGPVLYVAERAGTLED